MCLRRLCLILCVSNLAIAAVIPQEKEAIILSYDFQNDGRGNYEFSYDTSNDIKRKETGQLLNSGYDNEHIAVKGVYGYTDPEGKPRLYEYTADENGYRVSLISSDSIPDEQDSVPFPELPIAAPAPAAVIASLLGK